MKKWNEAEIIVVNISETANGKRHMNNENVHGPWANTMHDANHAQANCELCNPVTTADNDDIINSKS